MSIGNALSTFLFRFCTHLYVYPAPSFILQIHTHLFVVYRWTTIGIVCWASIGNMGGRQLEIVLNRFRMHFSQFYVYPDNNMSIGNVSGC